MPVGVQLERDRAYQRVLDLLLCGALSADEPLSERKLAERIGMGRTPVREALRALARDGVIDSRLARGTYVRQLSADGLREVYQVRQALEGMAAYLAAFNGPTPALATFGRRFRTMARARTISTAEIDDAGAAFHLEILAAARNATLLQVFEPLRLRFQIAFALPRQHDALVAQQSIAEHLAVLDAVVERDAAKARRLMCRHLERGLEVRLQIFSDVQKHQPGGKR